MAQSTTLRIGQTVLLPGTYVSTSVTAGLGTIGTAGVITLVGEADQGPHWSELEDLSQVAFRPDQLGAVLSTFVSGNLVDGFRAAISGNADAQIAGSPTLIYLIKTNKSDKASADILRSSFGKYAEMEAKVAGAAGNSINFQNSTSVSEVSPKVEDLGIYISPADTTDLKLRVNGGAELTASTPVVTTSLPANLVASLEALEADGILVQGGAARGVLPDTAATLSIASSGSDAVVTLSTGSWAVTPSVGDVALISTNTSNALSGGSQENSGTYRVIAATTSTITMTPVNTNAAVAPVAGVDQNVGLPEQALECYSPAMVMNATGMDRDILNSVTGNISATRLSESQLRLDLDASVLWAAEAKVGELVYIPVTFATVALDGWYQVSAFNNIGTGQMTLTRLSNGDLSGTGTSTAVTSTLVKSLKSDIDGVGKSLELISDANSDSIIKKAATGGSVEELDTLVVSAAERSVQTLVAKPAATNPITETFTAGGEVAIAIGYAGDTCSLTISDSELTTTTSVAADDLSLDLSQFVTCLQLVEFINSRTNYTAAVVDAKYNTMNPVKLDNVTVDAATSVAARPARIKSDADQWYVKVSQSNLIVLPAYASAGLPESEALRTYLSGGSKNGTAGVDVVDAIDACEVIDTNFIITLFDQDAASDIVDSKTEATSTYTAAAVNAYLKTHVLAQSEVKARKQRIGIAAVWTDLDGSKDQARNLSNPRMALTWFRIKDVASDGTIKTLPAWASACKCASQSAAAGYKGIVKKFVNISGAVYPQGFDPRRRGDLESVLEAGLLIVEPVLSGGFRWVSDQTTYSADNNFVYNSIQAMYVGDLITKTLQQNGDIVLVGKTVAQVTASVARGWMQTELDRMLRLKWLAPSDDAPLGYKDLSVKINGGVIEISVSLKINGIIYFVDIALNFEQVTQTA